ncbi:MAG: DMT family transporter [Phenylobacterium sp.]|uniref:DMT family transporter n=1 Tax=Phenylobacterium sp. TaxID=1871053 RepID=UPI00391A9E9F
MSEATQGRGAALAVLVFGACVIGTAPILVRLAEAGPAAAGFWRLLLALPLLALMAQRTDGGVGAAPKAALLAGVAFALDLGFWHYSIEMTSVANATVLCNLSPVVVTALAWIFLKQKVGPRFIAALALAVGGAALIAFGRPPGAPGSNPPLGDALALSTALWYALYFVAVSAARRNAGATRIMFWSTLTGIPLLLVAALAMGESILPASAAGWAACAALGVMHIVGQGSIAWALGRLPAATASVVVVIQPVVAALLGWLLFYEALGPLQAAGAAAALAGVVLAQIASRPKPAVAAA